MWADGKGGYMLRLWVQARCVSCLAAFECLIFTIPIGMRKRAGIKKFSTPI